MNQQNPRNLRESIIKYWDTAGLCSFESSTSVKDRNVASCDNYSETHLLESILAQERNIACLDVGAGLGRFTVVLAKHCEFVQAIEPAKELFYRLSENCTNFGNVEVTNINLEEFKTNIDYNFVVVSGILYLYPHNMLMEFLNIIINKMESKGTLVIRDFITKKGGSEIKSKFIDNGLCYYRDSNYWKEVAKTLGLDFVAMYQCSGSYNRILLKLLFGFHVTCLFRIKFVQQYYLHTLESKKKNVTLSFEGDEVKTVFMVMKKI